MCKMHLQRKKHKVIFNTMAAITYKLITGINIQKQMFSSKDLYDYLQVNLVFMCVCACVCVCVCVCVLVDGCEEQEKKFS